jgi:hypothetical protein
MSFSRYSIEKKQISNDRGVTWEDVTPAETRYGELIAVTRTLAECEDIDCDLEKDEYYVADGILPDNICANVIDTIPYGIASSVTFTDGAYCCDTWFTAGAAARTHWNNTEGVPIGQRVCGGGYCPTFAYYDDVDIHGWELHLGHVSNTCVGAVSTCLRIEQFMPWAEGKSTWKMIYKQHYTREHCSDEWVADGAEEFIAIGERWIKESEDFNNEYWRHQIASSFDESGNVTTWTDAELATRQMSTYTLPQYLDILDYVKNDGVAWVSLTNTSIPSPFIMDISLDGDLAASGYTYATVYKWFGTHNWANYTAAYYNDDNPGYFINYTSNTRGSTEKALKLTNTFQKISYGGETSHRRLFAYVDSTNDYGTNEGEPSGFAYGMRHGKMYDPTSEETIAFPYRIRENRGQQDDYYNSSEIGYILRDGTKLVIRTLT